MENENYKAVSPTNAVEENHLPGAMDVDEDAEAKERLTSDDPTKVKFISANSNFGRKNGDAKVDIENVQRTVGIGKEELMKYANEPFWVRLRMTLFILFWIIWFAMLIGSIIIIIFAPRCPPAPRLDWWQKSTPYQVLVSSFKDGNNDGVGDLQGLTSKLDYFKDIGIDALLLGPIYPSESVDNGYDITDYSGIHPEYGTLQDFDDLVAAIKTREMKLILEFVPNHSGDKHSWFDKSVNRQDPYTDYYVWSDSKPDSSGPPNNWASVTGGSAWTFNNVRKQYYLHQFHERQPDLNLRNPLVQEEMKKILQFWLDKGVDGFRVQGASYLFEDAQLRNEPSAKNSSYFLASDYDHLDHIYTKHQPETFELLKDWRELLNNFSSSSGSHKVLMADVNESANNSVAYYGNGSRPLVDLPLNQGLLSLTAQMTGQDILRVIQSWIAVIPSDLWPNWVLGNQDVSRLATRVGDHMLDALHMVILLSKGTPVVYYGDEIGMEDVPIHSGEVRDRLKRDKARTPMQWDNSTTAGFTESSHPWLPLSNKSQRVNVKVELDDPHSHLGIVKSLMRIRNQQSIRLGLMEFPVVTDQLFSMMRIRKGSPGYLVLVNTGTNSTEVNLSGTSKMLPESARVEIVSRGTEEGRLSDAGSPKIELNSIYLGPKQSAVLTFVPKFD